MRKEDLRWPSSGSAAITIGAKPFSVTKRDFH